MSEHNALKRSSFFIIPIFLSLAACATYTDQISKVRSALLGGESNHALTVLEKTDIAHRSRDEVLFRMERGMLHYLSGRNEDATKDWAKASKRSEELYTTSLGKTLASLTVSEDMTDYEGEDHEKILLPIFSSLAYFSAGELGKALVEIRRTYELINQLKLDRDDAKFRIDGFPYLISGLLYEASANWDAAIIEYRKSLVSYLHNKSDQSSEIEKLVADSLWRIAEFRRRDDIITFLSDNGFKKPKQTLNQKLSEAEIFVIFEDGQSPIKVAQDYLVNLGTSVINLSFPRYQQISNPGWQTQILCDGSVCGQTSKSSDIGELAQNALERRRLKDFAKMTARLIAKEQVRRAAQKQLGDLGSLAVMVANLATERADTRSWTLLPANIQIARISVPAEKNVTINISHPTLLKPHQWVIKLPAGKKRLLRVRGF
jgi:hypothetical protein